MSITLNYVVSLSPQRHFNKESGKRSCLKVGCDNQIPERRVFPAVDNDVDRAVEDEENVGDVAELGAPDRPVPVTQALDHQSNL